MQNVYSFFGLLPGLIGAEGGYVEASCLQTHDNHYFMGDESQTKSQALLHVTHIATVRNKYENINAYNIHTISSTIYTVDVYMIT